MPEISFKKAITKTIIEFDNEFMEKVWDSLICRTRSIYIPPLFDEYTIILTEKNKNRTFVEMSLSNDLQFLMLPSDKKEKFIDETLKANNLENDVITYFCVQYLSATEWTITVFEGDKHKKSWIVECAYINEPDEFGNNYAIKVRSTNDNIQFSTISKGIVDQIGITNLEEYAQHMGTFALDIVNIVSYYMQHYNPEIEYKIIKAEKLKKTEKKNGNLGYSQKIVLKSKVKRYVLSNETHEINIKKMRTYRKTKPCWYVRGYYQHYGKDKILKYIPPRINYRQGVKPQKKPKQANYELK